MSLQAKTDLEASISRARQSIPVLLRPLQPVSSTNSIPSSSRLPPRISDLPQALLALLSSLRHAITTLSLAVKPPATPAAIIAQLDKVDDLLGKSVACVLACSGGEAWGVSQLADEWRLGVSAIGDEVRGLVEVLDAPAGQDAYLSHTGMVWQAIDGFVTSMSHDESKAVKKKLQADYSIVKDAWEEYEEALEADDQAKEDEGLDELELLGGMSLSPEAKARAIKAKPLLSLASILHVTLPRFVPVDLTARAPSFSPLLTASQEFVAAYDDTVASLTSGESDGGLIVAMKELDRCCMQVARVAQIGEGDQVGGFLQKWNVKWRQERSIWDERKLGMREMQTALEE